MEIDASKKGSQINTPPQQTNQPPTGTFSNLLKDAQDRRDQLGPFQQLPINASAFMQSLPEILKSFINECIEIIKRQSKDHSFKFTFRDISLHITIKKKKDSIEINIMSSDEDLNATLFTPENREKLRSILESTFPNQSVVLTLSNGND